MLRGDSVIDWHRLDFEGPEAVQAFLRNHQFDPDDPRDQRYLAAVRDEAVAYLKRNFRTAIPRPIATASLPTLLEVASGRGHRQVCACTVLKAMHVIHHLNGRELLFRLPVSDHDVFHLVEEKVYRVVGAMLAQGFPISEFIGGRKNLDSTYTKLLSKAESTSAALYDKLRFRIVTQRKEDLMPVLDWLLGRLFPFTFVVPRESSNTLFHFRSWCERHPKLRGMIPSFQGEVGDELIQGDNHFSSPVYRVIHFVVDIPVRVPENVRSLAPPGCESLGPVIYVLCEFQLLDAESEAANEAGDANHEAYKQRQRRAVYRRLRISAQGRGRSRA